MLERCADPRGDLPRWGPRSAFAPRWIRHVLVFAFAPLAACSLLTDFSGYIGVANEAGASGTDGSIASSCTGAACVSASCAPSAACVPVALVTGESEPRGIVVDDAFVYWVDHGTGAIMRAPKGGGARQTLATAPTNSDLSVLDLDSDYAYVPDPGNSALYRVAKAGGALQTIVTGQAGGASGIAIADGYAYFTTSVGLKRVPADGSAPSVDVALDGKSVHGRVRVFGTRVFWTVNDGVLGVDLSTIGALPVSQTQVICQMNNWTMPVGMVVDATNIYMVDSVAGGKGGVYEKIISVGCNGTNAFTLASGLSLPFEEAQDTDNIYFTTSTQSGSVSVVSKAVGGTTKVLAQAQDQPWGVALDPLTRTLYWTSSGATGAIMALGQP